MGLHGSKQVELLRSKSGAWAGDDGVSEHPRQLKSKLVFHFTYYTTCMHFRVLKMIATSGFLAVRVQRSRFRPGLPGPRGGSLHRSPNSLAGLKGAILPREEKMDKGEGRVGEWGREEKGREGDGGKVNPPAIPVYAPGRNCARVCEHQVGNYCMLM